MNTLHTGHKYQPETGSFAEAAKNLPNVALTVQFEEDNSFIWIGDCEEPETPAHVVTITAHKVVNGRLFEGKAYLGGCYPLEDEELDFEVSGYAPQMIQEALEDLGNVIAETFPIDNL